MRNMPYTSPMIPVLIPDPAGVKLHLLFAWGSGYDHGRVLVD